ncbi:MAG: GAF domain-containing protein [Faecalibacterium sp.]|nr:GAF domain-containing protein [Faecalibacterium sp.]
MNQPQTEKQAFYRLLCAQGEALTMGETDCVANLANLAALLWQELPDINWVGFYRLHRLPGGGQELILAPFAGKPACIHIAVGKGVCGTAVAQNATQLVRDVHAFPGHIACDSASNSEIVVSLRYGGAVVGVLDIDSPQLARFDEADQEGLEQFAAVVEAACGAQLAAMQSI